MDVKLIISDFDGTLVDTFEANYQAYRDAFSALGLSLSRGCYRKCFGLRFDNFMNAVNITDEETKMLIRQMKAESYPKFFNCFKINVPLLDFIRAFHNSGGKTAIASTARERNLKNALSFIDAESDFDIILAGENVNQGKPSPEIYNTVLSLACCKPSEALIFEDSEVGFMAAKAAGINYISINKNFFGNGN